MSIPTYKEIELPLLFYIYTNGGEVKSSSCYTPLGKELGLTDEEFLIPLETDQTRKKWENMVRWARNELVKKGFINRPENAEKGIWKLTESGLMAAQSLDEKFEINYSGYEESETFIEGSSRQITVNRYERNRDARIKCINHHGYKCSVCNMDFSKQYGDIGKNFIHVHHKTSIASIGKEYILDPIEDLCPVCPNCHAMLHRKTPPLSVDELKRLISLHHK